MDTQIQPKDPKEQLEAEMQQLVQESVAVADPLVKGTTLTAVEKLGLPKKDAELEASIQSKLEAQEMQDLVQQSLQNIDGGEDPKAPLPAGIYDNEEEAARIVHEGKLNDIPLVGPPLLNFERLQLEQRRWSAHNFGHLKCDYNAPFKGLVEEVGELSHSFLKQEQGIRGTFEEHEAKAKDAIGDIIVFLADICTKRGWSMQQIIEDTWGEVSQRDFRKFPKNGLTE